MYVYVCVMWQLFLLLFIVVGILQIITTWLLICEQPLTHENREREGLEANSLNSYAKQ